jgi:hypothetical protein
VKTGKITVYVNDKPKVLFLGMCVKHAIGVRWTNRVKLHRALVLDAAGNRVEIDGALHDGERLSLAPIDAQQYAEDVQRRT